MKRLDFPASPTGVIQVPVPELERRQTDINCIVPTHPLLPLALDCIKDKDRQRPSAAQLCQRLVALKETQAYAESVQGRQEEAVGEQQQDGWASLEKREREIAELREQPKQSEEQFQETVQHLAKSQDTVRAKDHQIDAHKLQEKRQWLQGKDRFTCPHQWQVQEKHRQLQEKRASLKEKEREIGEIQEQLKQNEAKLQETVQQLAESQDTVRANEQQIRQKDKLIGTNQQQLREKVARIKAVEEEGRASLEEKEREIGEIQEQLKQNEAKLQETVQQLAESQDTVSANEQQIRKTATRIEALKRENFMLEEAERQLREMKDTELQLVRREVAGHGHGGPATDLLPLAGPKLHSLCMQCCCIFCVMLSLFMMYSDPPCTCKCTNAESSSCQSFVAVG